MKLSKEGRLRHYGLPMKNKEDPSESVAWHGWEVRWDFNQLSWCAYDPQFKLAVRDDKMEERGDERSGWCGIDVMLYAAAQHSVDCIALVSDNSMRYLHLT